MTLVQGDFVQLIKFHVYFVGVLHIGLIGVAVVEKTHIIENAHDHGIPGMKQLNGANNGVMTEFIGEGDFLGFDIEILLIFNGADGAVERFPQEP